MQGTAERTLETPLPRGREFEQPGVVKETQREVANEASPFVSRTVRRRRIMLAVVVSDALMAPLAVLTATLVRFGNISSEVATPGVAAGPGYLQLSIGVSAALLVFMFAAHLYDVDRLGWGSGELVRIARSMTLGMVGIILAMYAIGVPYVSRQWAILVWILAAAFVVSGRMVLRLIGARILRHGGWLQRPTLIVGSNVEAAEIARILRANPEAGLIPIGCLSSSLMDKLSFDYCAPTIPNLGNARELVRVVTERGVDTVVVIASAFDYEVLQRMIQELSSLPVTAHVASALSEVLPARVGVREVSGVPLISLDGLSLSPMQFLMKRSLDLAVGGLIVILGMPIWVAVGLLIKVTSEGPVFYKQLRVGKRGQPFWMYKFRSMRVDADQSLGELRDSNEADGPLFKIRSDPRLTKIGAWMRRFSIDEFPQLINVLKGEMSLVGPRPPLEVETLLYTEREWRRLEVAPGMTGLWQVSGRSELTFNEMVRLDLFYIDNWSVGLDLSLLVRTLPAVVSARGAY